MNNILASKINEQRQEIKSDRMDMSFGEIINMFKDGEIIISPEYQRAFRWDKQRQTDFIESILLGIPFPSIFVATNDDGTWELIDGLQRISTVLSFFGELKDSDRNNLVLEEGNIVTELKGVTVNSIPIELKLAIKRTPCRVEIIQKESNFEMRYELFKRLNTGGEGLTRQEIRNCIFRGFVEYEKFSKMIKYLSQIDCFKQVINISYSQEQEMLLDELVLRFFSLYLYRHEYTEKTIQDFFDKIMKRQCETPDSEAIAKFEEKFIAIFSFINNIDPNGDMFRLARLNFSTSMYDSIVIALAETNKDIKNISSSDFLCRVDSLKKDNDFKSHAGSASSNATNIREKLRVAKKILLGE